MTDEKKWKSRSLFELLDTNGDGKIDEKELQKGLDSGLLSPWQLYSDRKRKIRKKKLPKKGQHTQIQQVQQAIAGADREQRLFDVEF